jgi:carbon-monoxide dehydrogenase large subunit
MSKFGMGQPMRRVEDARLLTGTGTYLDDVKLDGCAHGVFVRSPLAHAEIGSVEIEDAKAAPGVIAVYTIADLDAAGVGPVASRARAQNIDGSDMALPERPVLARGRVRHVGDPVVFVVAETLAQARDAAELVEVDYNDLPVIADTAGAVEPGAPQIWDVAPNNTCFHWDMGDESATEAAFANAHRVTELMLVNNRVSANPMETRGALAAPDPETGKTKVWLSSQGVFGLHNELAAVLNIDKSELRVVTTDVGGGFGMKIFNYPEYVAVTFATRALDRPVRWISDRTEALISDDHGRDVVTVAKLALDANHRFLGLRVDSVANLGAYVSQYAAFVATAAGCTMIPGVYAIPVSYVTVKGAFTNTNPVDAYRGAGRPEAAYMIERLVDKTARELGIATDELRRRNFIPAAAMPYTTCTGLVYDSGDFNNTLTKGQQLADWDGFAVWPTMLRSVPAAGPSRPRSRWPAMARSPY